LSFYNFLEMQQYLVSGFRVYTFCISDVKVCISVLYMIAGVLEAGVYLCMLGKKQ